MEDSFIAGDNYSAPSIEQWAARDDIMLTTEDNAQVAGAQAAGRESLAYYFSHEALRQPIKLKEELENCFRAGNWLSTICVSAAICETFMVALEQSPKAKGFSGRMAEEGFPYVDDYMDVRANRNKIMHPKNNNQDDSIFWLTQDERFALAHKALAVAYVFMFFGEYKKGS